METLFKWRKTIASKHGPEKAVTRHVLITLSLHMKKNGASCFPSTKTLAAETGLSERTVCTHLEIAEKEGWIKKMLRGLPGKKWKRHEYVPFIPKKALKEVQHLNLEGTETDSAPFKKGTESHAEGTESDDNKALKEVQSRSSYRSSTRSSKKYTSDSDEIRLSHLLLDLILKRDPEYKRPKNLQKWAVHIDRLIRLDNRTPEKIEAVIRWCQANTFWQTNILSTKKLIKLRTSVKAGIKPVGILNWVTVIKPLMIM